MNISATATASDKILMRPRPGIARRHFIALAAAVAATLGGCATTPRPMSSPAELIVLTSGGFKAAVSALSPHFEAETGKGIRLEGGPSMGTTPQAIPARLARREPADVVIMVREALDGLVAKGEVLPGSVTDLARSKIAMAVRAGAPAPDISTMDAFRATLVAAESIAYSDSASGVHLSQKLFPAMGLSTELAPKARMIPATPVGEIVASGGAQIGFQQLSELKAVEGIDIVGLIPDDAQKVTTFSAGIISYSKRPKEARKFIEYLASGKSRRQIVETGMETVRSAEEQVKAPSGH